MKTSCLGVPALLSALLLSAPTAAASPFGVPQVQVAGSSLGSAPVFHPGAPVPVPFTPDYLIGYVSDVSSHGLLTYHDVTAGFTALRANEELMARNLELTLAANNSATPELIARAQLDSAADSEGLLFALSDALGSRAVRLTLRRLGADPILYIFDGGECGIEPTTFRTLNAGRESEPYYLQAARRLL